MNIDFHDDVIKTREVAQLMGISESYFYKLKSLGKTPPHLKINSINRIRYSRKIVESWIKKQEELLCIEVDKARELCDF